MGWLPHTIDHAEVDSDIDRGINALHQRRLRRVRATTFQAGSGGAGWFGRDAYVAVAHAAAAEPRAYAPAAAGSLCVNMLLTATKDSRRSPGTRMLWATARRRRTAAPTTRRTPRASATQSADRAAQAIFTTGGTVRSAKPADLPADEKASPIDRGESAATTMSRKKTLSRANRSSSRIAVALPLSSVPALALKHGTIWATCLPIKRNHHKRLLPKPSD